MLIFMLEPEVDVKSNVRLVNKHHSSSLSLGKRGKSIRPYGGNTGTIYFLFQEGEQAVSSEQREAGQMDSVCEERVACESVGDGLSYHWCDTYANVLCC